MNDISNTVPVTEAVVSTVPAHLKNRKIEDAITCFAEEFRFKDYGIGLEFKDKHRLAELFQKTNELYPNTSLQVDAIFGLRQGDRKRPFGDLVIAVHGGLVRSVPISLHGVSIVRIDNDRITDWSDYYDGLTARRTALASYFTEWVDC